MNKKRSPVALALLIAFGLVTSAATAQQKPPQKPPAGAPPATSAQKPTAPPVVPAPAVQAPASLPPDYVLGPDDTLHVEFWRDKDLSADVTVRPDGKVTLPVLNDVQAAGLTPDQFRDRVLEAAKRFIEDPSVTISVKEIRSRKVFITGAVNKPGAYLINDHMTVLQLIATAGGLTEFAKSKNIIIMRPDAGGVGRPAGQPITYAFNYKDVLARKNLKQNIELKPGDTVIVPE
jgi:polysaccharide biosynthesis/export protein